MRKIKRALSIVLLITVFVFQVGCSSPAVCDQSAIDSQEELMACVTMEGVRQHLQALQAIADKNDGNRAAGTPGYEDSVAYVVDTLQAEGYEVEFHEFEFTLEPPPTLQQTGPTETEIRTGKFFGSGSGEINGPVVPVDLALGQEPWPADPATATSGCEASDFAALDFSGMDDIALVQGGACLESNKVLNAEEAGAEAVIVLMKEFIADEGGPVGRADKMLDGSPSNIEIPVIGVQIEEGSGLAQDGATAYIQVIEPKLVKQRSVLAELLGRSDGKAVMVGAHLDSVLAAPGLSDNGSGSAAILETAVQMSNVEPHNTVRFAWWGAEEYGLVGSRAYVESLTHEGLDEIAMYLNFDMIASPNPVYVIYDCENDQGGQAKPAAEGSCAIEQLFASYYERLDLPYQDSEGEIGSDHIPFILAGIPTGGLFAGAEGRGTDGEVHDPCYHKACDTVDNIDYEALGVNADGVAYAVLHYAMEEGLE